MAESALIVSATAPVPVDNGKRAVLNGLLTYFVERLGPENVHYAVLGKIGEEHPPFHGTVHPIVKPGTAGQLLALRRWVGSRSYTVQEAMLGTRSLRRQLQELIADLQPTIEVWDTLRLGQHAPASPRARRRVLYLDDLFSVRYQRMLDVAAAGDVDMDPLGGFVDNVPARLRPLARRPAVYLPLLRSERDRIRRREAEVVHDYDSSLLVNSREVSELRQRAGIDRVGVLTPLLPPIRAVQRRPVDPPEFVYLGKLNIPHNDDAICTFLRTSMAELSFRLPRARVRIIGKSPSPALRALVEQHPGATLEGFVEDIDEIFSRSTAVLAPLRFGSGVKIKVLEALGRGVPVLATTVAAEGIPVRPDGADGCVVEDDLTRWPSLLAALARETDHRGNSTRALDFHSRTYGPDVVFSQYDEIFDLSPAPLTRPHATPQPTG